MRRSSNHRGVPTKGRGACSNPAGRFETTHIERPHDEWGSIDDPQRRRTTLTPDPARSVISRNHSPDVPFELSINPYRGCEHGCIYCYARPSHAYLNLSPGLDFETRLFFKKNAAKRLEEELRRPGYRCRPITLGANTDPYQPAERRLRVTRSILKVLQRFQHPVSIITKSSLVERDIDLLEDMARRNLVAVIQSVTTLDPALKRTLEPRAASPASRLQSIRELTAAAIPVGVLVAPVIPAVNDMEIEKILEACATAGALTAGYVLLRLPYEVKDLFREWLELHLPLRADRVMNRIKELRGGKENDPRFGYRMRGSGVYAALLEQRFRLGCQRFGLEAARKSSLDTGRFRVPPTAGTQFALDL